MTFQSVDRWLHKAEEKPYIPLVLIPVIQAVFASLLTNSPFQDEALYIQTGRWMIDSWMGHVAFNLYPDSYFSGAPEFYPVFAGWLDAVGGLQLVRSTSLLFMAAATVLVYKATENVFAGARARRTAIFAAASFAFCTSVLFVSNFATFDAPCFCAVVIGFWMSTKALTHKASRWWVFGASLALTLAIFLKYASIVAVCFVFIVSVASAKVPWKRRLLTMATVAGVMVILIGGSLLTWAGPLWDGFVSTTANRTPKSPTSSLTLVGKLIEWAWVPALVAVVGFAALVRSRPLTAVCLLAGTATCVGLQVLSGENISLQKHVVLSLIFAAPLCGYALTYLSAVRLGAPIVTVVLAAMLYQGVTQSNALFEDWPDSRPLVSAASPLIEKDPSYRILGDIPEPLMYALYDKTDPNQWQATYSGSFKYKGQADLPAFRTALQDHYFELVIIDSYSDNGKELVNALEPAGYTKVKELTDHHTYRKWSIYRYTGA